MDSPSNEKTLPRWFYPMTAAVNILADAVVLFSLIVHLEWVPASDSLFRFVAFDFSTAEFVAVVLLIGTTIFSGIIRSKFGTPEKLTVGTCIYHSVVMTAAVFIQYFNDISNISFPYPVLVLIPVITTVLSLLFLFWDWHGRKVNRQAPESKKRKPERRSRRGTTFSALTESSFSDYIDDLSPAPAKSLQKSLSVRKKHTPSRRRKLNLKKSPRPKAAGKANDYSNDVKDLFSDINPAFRQGGTILDSILGEPPSSEKKGEARRTVSTKPFMEEFPDIPEEEQKGSVWEKPSGTTKLSSSDASEALKNHKNMK